MPRYYHAEIMKEADSVTTVRIGFGDPAQNDLVVPEAVRAIAELHLAGGRGVRFNGSASLPVAFAIAHAVGHLFGFVACFDPKLGKYVVSISHDPDYRVGDLLNE